MRHRWNALLVAAGMLAACSSDDGAAPDASAAETVDTGAVVTTGTPTTEPIATTAAATTEPASTDLPTTTTTTPPPTTEAPSTPVELGAAADLYAPVQVPAGSPHGTLLRYQRVEPSVFAGADTWRVMYTSAALDGAPIVVTGTVVVPAATSPMPEGGRNIVALVHGTTGSADVCAPSLNPSAPSELGALGPLVDAGAVVAATDYEGMGTPGLHPYLVGVSEGRSGLDGALAARALPGADVGSQLGVMGYSQGGHAAMWAAQLAAEWAPDLDLVGTFAGAPPTEIDLVVNARLTGFAASFMMLLVNGFSQAYAAELAPDGILTADGIEFLPAADEVCVGELAATLADFTAADYLDPPDPRWSEIAAANNAGTTLVDAPLLIVHSSTDDVVPAALSEIALGRMCALGQVIERRSPDLGGHGAAVGPAYQAGMVWMQQRFDHSAEPITTC